MLETIHLSHLPHTLPLYVSLYSSLQNATFLRQQLLDGNTEFEYAFIDASMILSRTHVLAACFRALNDYLNERLKSRNVHSEIVYAMSPNNNITLGVLPSLVKRQSEAFPTPLNIYRIQIGEAFSRFGIQTSTTNLLVIKVGNSNTTSESLANHLQASIQGTAVAFTDENLARLHDLGKVRKVYRIPGRPPSTGAPSTSSKTKIPAATTHQPGTEEEEPEERERLERGILGAMALRGAT